MVSKTLEKHQHLLKFLKRQSKEDALKAIDELVKQKLIGKIGYKALKNELGIE